MTGLLEFFSVQPLCALCLCGERLFTPLNQRDTEVAQRRLLRRADNANELREFGWSEIDVVLRVEQQPIAVEFEVQCGIVRCFGEHDLDGEGVFCGPRTAGGHERISRNTEGVFESVGKHAATVGPGVSSNSNACFAARSADDYCR